MYVPKMSSIFLQNASFFMQFSVFHYEYEKYGGKVNLLPFDDVQKNVFNPVLLQIE